MLVALIFISFVLTAAGIWIFRKVTAGSKRLLDLPNERSSHAVPVTRGAGLSIVVVVLGLYIYVSWDNADPAFLIAAGIIAAVGFLDDIFSTPLLLRLAVQIAAASVFVYFSGSYAGTAGVSFGFLSSVISMIFIVWVTNAFNFMDGIDGIAGIQGVGAALGWLFLGMAIGSSPIALFAAILLGSCAGFLLFNWPPAKVFMGDVGSTFLGFTFASFPLIGDSDRSPTGYYGLAAAMVFLWLFLFDTIFTRTRQVVKLKRFWLPHRDHLYQRIVIGGSSHSTVSLLFGSFGVAAAFAACFALNNSVIPLIAILVLGPISLLLWAWNKRLT